jgi:hypothetical protein
MRHAFRVNGADHDTGPSVEYRSERAERCLCGGFLIADQADERSIYWAVVRHRRTLGHQAWLARVEGG